MNQYRIVYRYYVGRVRKRAIKVILASNEYTARLKFSEEKDPSLILSVTRL